MTCFAVPGLRRSLGELADRFYAKPSADVSVVGITGTNGKTTCAWLFANGLQAPGQRCGLMGSLGYGFNDDLQQQDLTTPDVVAVHRRLDELRSAGASAVVMEVSSHALDQGRVDGVRFAAAAFTNLSRDHLDYHGDLESYGAAKAAMVGMSRALAIEVAGYGITVNNVAPGWIGTGSSTEQEKIAAENTPMRRAGRPEEVAELIAFISRDTTLLPGTVILTGTPEGVGFARQPPVFLADGDIIEVTIEGIGTLSNPVRNA